MGTFSPNSDTPTGTARDIVYPRHAAERGSTERDLNRTDPLDLLTARERDVARRVGRGASNAEIALDLDIGVRTVEFHLTNAYRKLDVSRRTQLAVLVASTGPHLASPDGRWGGA